jgi:hypothetical protein
MRETTRVAFIETYLTGSRSRHIRLPRFCGGLVGYFGLMWSAIEESWLRKYFSMHYTPGYVTLLSKSWWLWITFQANSISLSMWIPKNLARLPQLKPAEELLAICAIPVQIPVDVPSEPGDLIAEFCESISSRRSSGQNAPFR